MRALALTLALLIAPGTGFAAEIESSVEAATLPKGKRTALKLYLTPLDAAKALETDESIVFIDVRDPVEFQFVGHPVPADQNVPVAFVDPGRSVNAKKKSYNMVGNPAFTQAVEALLVREGKTKSDPVFVMCRSGGRSARAANILAKAGFTKVYNIVEGFEGDKDKTSKRRSVNGWKNADLPWTTDLLEGQAYTPPGQ